MLTPEIVAGAAQAAGLDPAAIVLRSLGNLSQPVVQVAPESLLYPASMIKTPLAVAAYTDVADGRLRLDDRVACTPANMTFNDKPSPLEPEYRATVRELIELMITISDNVATNMFFDILGRDRATDIVQHRYGLTHTAFFRKLSGSEPLIHDAGWNGKRRNTHPPADAAALFALIAADRVPFAAELRATLGRQQFNDKLSLGLRTGDRFYHKTGETDEVTHDGGILETAEGRSYAIVVYTGLTDADPVKNTRFAPFMSAIRPLL